MDSKLVVLPFYDPVSAKIGRVHSKWNFKMVFHPATKTRQLLCPVKDDLRESQASIVFPVPVAADMSNKVWELLHRQRLSIPDIFIFIKWDYFPENILPIF